MVRRGFLAPLTVLALLAYSLGCTRQNERNARTHSPIPAPRSKPSLQASPTPALPKSFRPLRILRTLSGCEIELAGVDSFFYVSGTIGGTPVDRTLRLREDGTIDRTFEKLGRVFGNYPAPLYFRSRDETKHEGWRWDGSKLSRASKHWRAWHPWMNGSWLREERVNRRVKLFLGETDQPVTITVAGGQPTALHDLLVGAPDISTIPEYGIVKVSPPICPDEVQPSGVVISCQMIGTTEGYYFTSDPNFDPKHIPGSYAPNGPALFDNDAWLTIAPTKPTIWPRGLVFGPTPQQAGFLAGPKKKELFAIVFDGAAFFAIHRDGIYRREHRASPWTTIAPWQYPEQPTLWPEPVLVALSDALYVSPYNMFEPLNPTSKEVDERHPLFRVGDGLYNAINLQPLIGVNAWMRMDIDKRGNLWIQSIPYSVPASEKAVTLTNAPGNGSYTCEELLTATDAKRAP